MPQLTRLESELRKRARELIHEGRLPDHAPARAWGGVGSGQPCALCGENIPASDVEYEVDTGEGHTRRTLHFHFGCHAAWQLECLRADFTARADKKKEPARSGMRRSKPKPTENERVALPKWRWLSVASG